MRSALLLARKKAGLTQEKLAQKVGIDRSSYAHIEKGTRNPSLSTAYKITQVLGVRPDEIFLPSDVLKRHKDNN